MGRRGSKRTRRAQSLFEMTLAWNKRHKDLRTSLIQAKEIKVIILDLDVEIALPVVTVL